jgi:nicotinamide phosphoribosyltransferase
MGWSTDNIAFGMGGALLQQVHRDTQKFAMKASAVQINGQWHPIYKDPVTDPGKISKAGRLTLYRNFNGSYHSSVEDWPEDSLVTVYKNGELINETTFDEIRARARA